MKKVSQAKIIVKEASTWTVKVYHIQDGNANTILYLYPNIAKKQLYGRLREDVRNVIKTLCAYKHVEIVEGAVCSDHVHLCVCIPPKMSVSSFMGYLKGKSALMLYDKHPELQSKWSKAFWARGYYVATVGNITEEAIKKYISEQSEESRKEDSDGAAF